MNDSHIHIGSLYQLFSEETQPFRKVHRMIDLFESIIKSHTAVILGEYVKQNTFSDAAKGMLAQGLRTPSLGTWQLFSRVLFCELQSSAHNWLIDELQDEFIISDNELISKLENGKILFPTYDKEKLLLLKSERKKRKSNFDDVIVLRNSYAHGATPTDAQCEADIKQFEPFLHQLLELEWLNNSSLELRDGKVFVTTEKAALSLHPILLYREENSDASFAFFNDLKNDKVGLLNYPLSKHYREKDFYREFHEYLPLHEWKKTGSSDFTQRIEELTETFKGRIAERAKIHDFVLSKSKGYLSIQGNPGIGKSALIAQVFKEIKSSTEAKQIHCIEYFIRRGTQQADVDYLLNYLIKRTDEVFPQGREIRAEGKMTFDLQNQLFSKWRLWAEHSQGKKLLFLIDGLDEAVEKNVLTYMPRENFENILIIYGSRPGGHKSIDELWATLPPEHHTPLLLKGLSMADIRALIYDVANKYELERESVWIDAVQKRSQGNPLYLRLLCNAIENSSIAINDLNALPKEIDEYYKAILSRYAQDMIDGDALLAGLFTFAAAKDYLTMAHLGLTNQLGDATIQRIGSTLKEVLYENPLTDGVLDYQLFHESFREYLVKEKAKQVNDAAERILDFCASWDTLEGTWEQRYALEHYASHLSESKKEVRVKELWGILENNRYKETQKKVLKRYDASRDLARIGLLKASELKQFDLQLECALQLVDLKYEEANGAPQVVALVADGEIDLALKRIESFGGSDQEGVKRRFILYMLCLMELTLLDSKTKTFRKAAIEKLLNHFDEQIPTDLSILNWSKFFPNDIVIKMSRVMSDLSIDYVVIYRRADESVLLTAQIDIADYLFNQGKIEEVALLINRMLDFWCDFPYALDKAVSMAKIATECFKFGNKQLAASLMNDAITGINDDINHDYYRNEAIAQISIEFSRQKLFKEALSVANQISEESTKSSVYGKISVQLSKEGQFNDALALVNGISSSIENAPTFAKISTELWREGQFIEAQTNMCKAISGARLITKCVDDAQQNGQPKNHTHSIAQMNRSSVLCVIIREHLEQGRIDESIDYVKDLILEHKSQIFVDIARKLFEKGEKKKSASFLKEAITSANDILEESDKCSSLVDISIEYNIQGYFNEAKLSMQKALEVAENNSSILLNIANQLSNGGQLVEAKQKIQYLLSLDTYNTNETLESQGVFYFAFNLAKQGRIKEAFHFASEYYEVDLTGLCKELTNIAKELIIEGRMEEALAIANQINNKHNDRDEALVNIAAELSRQGQHQEAISIVHEIEYEYCISLALAKIATDLTQCGFTKEAESLMQSALTCSRDIEDECDKTMALTNIVKELSKYGNEQEALHLTQEALISLGEDYSFYYYGVDALASIATELLNLGQLKQALFIINDIEDGIEKYEIQVKIVTELSKRGQMEKALAIAHDIDDEIEKNKALMNISTVLYKQGEIEKSEDLMKEAIDSVNDINDEYFRCRVLSDIATAFFEQSNWSAAEEIGAQIPLMQQRYDCWRQGASVLVDSVGWEKSLKSIALLRSSEAKLHYAKGWTENLNLSAVNDMCLNDSLPILFEDSNSIEIVLRKYAIRAVTKEKIPNNILDRLNRTLKIDWFFSIIDRLPKEENKVMRSSSNLNNWLHEILDEDDRDQIELWAKQVAKGKISEDEFKEKLVTLNLN